VSELLRVGAIEPSGRIKPPDEVRPEWLADRVSQGERGREITLVESPEVRLTQGDIREVQLGKAALCAGIKVLLAVAGVKAAELRTTLIAGSFGSALRPRHVRALGILPPEYAGKVQVIGNSAIEGAKIFLTSLEARAEARDVALYAEHIELFTRPEFKNEFYTNMAFPTSAGGGIPDALDGK
jgi:uncharacterized 2Fe-2S/4Fe-4S cluster protein (DUF4445 family)